MVEAPPTAGIYRSWLLLLVFPFRFGSWLSSAIIFPVAYLIFSVLGAGQGLSDYVTVFFSLIMAYMIPIFAYIVRRSEEAFDRLEPALDGSEEERAVWRATLSGGTMRWHAVVTTAALIAGSVHMGIMEELYAAELPANFSLRDALVTHFGTLMVWVVMTTVISTLMRNAAMFSRLGRENLRVALFRNDEMSPLADVAVISTLSMIGAQVVLAILLLDPVADWRTIAPGVIATAVNIVPLMVLPVWSVHVRLRRCKEQELARLRISLDALAVPAGDELSDATYMDDRNRLLLYRREVMQASEWPFDLGALTRFGLYLVIPPLTWVGAALIENLVDSVL